MSATTAAHNAAALAATLEQTTTGEPVVFRNLTVLPLLRPQGTGALPPPFYYTIDEALARGAARITEVSEGGSVPELKLVNDSDHAVLLLDGEELVGAKQNRTVNVTLLVPPRVTLNIPVTCVEAGRWAHTSREFAAAPRAHFARGRMQKAAQVTANLKRIGSYAADQHAVWEEIDAKAERMRAHSPTRAMSAVYERHAAAVEDYVKALTAASVLEQVGALFAIDGRVAGLDRFDHPATLAKLLPKLVRSYALDAVDAGGGSSAAASLPREVAAAFLAEVAKATCKGFPAIGMGENIRLSAPRLAGGALLANGSILHLGAFRLSGPEEEVTPQPGVLGTLIQRASARVRRL